MKKKKLLSAVSVVFLLLSVPLTVLAIRSATGPTEQKGGYYHTLVDRVDVSADHTEFTFQKSGADDETFALTFLLTVKKSEADFYAKIDGLELTGISYTNAAFLCQTPGFENAAPVNLLLPAQNGESVPVTWQVTVNTAAQTAGDYTATLRLSYTAGLTKESADSRILEIPLSIHVK